MAEQRYRKPQVAGSTPVTSSNLALARFFDIDIITNQDLNCKYSVHFEKMRIGNGFFSWRI